MAAYYTEERKCKNSRCDGVIKVTRLWDTHLFGFTRCYSCEGFLLLMEAGMVAFGFVLLCCYCYCCCFDKSNI